MAHKKFRVSKHVICNEPRCRNVTTGRYCEEHQRQTRTDERTERDRFLDTAAWRKLSKLKLRETPWCEDCLELLGVYRPANDVDHVLPRRERPDLALHKPNLRSLCKRHHGMKTGKGG